MKQNRGPSPYPRRTVATSKETGTLLGGRGSRRWCYSCFDLELACGHRTSIHTKGCTPPKTTLCRDCWLEANPA